jgi:hypothetical protein
LDMRQGIQRDLPAMERRRIAAQLRHQRVCTFMAGGRKQKHDVPDHAEAEELGVHAAA